MDHAKANMEEKQPVRIQSMMEVFSEMMGGMPDGMLPEGDGPQMYVMSNETKINGAAAMVFTEKSWMNLPWRDRRTTGEKRKRYSCVGSCCGMK